jgi:hypothetical protein
VGKVIQRKDYVIIFNASWKSFEDTLLFFDCEIKEAGLKEPFFKSVLENAAGVHADSLNHDGTFTHYYGIRKTRIVSLNSEKPFRPCVVHFLHFRKKGEIEAHNLLSAACGRRQIPMVNPYNTGTSNCDSKYRMFEVLRDLKIPTPDAVFISRFNKRKADSFKDIIREFVLPGEGLYIQPDRGTEGRGCCFLKKGDHKKADNIIARMEPEEEDLIVRREVGNILYNGDNLIFRINVCHDGDEFFANSGFCMVGGKVVSFETGAVKKDINNVINHLKLDDMEISRIKDVSCNAVKAVFKDAGPSLLTGVDLILEKEPENAGYIPYVIDINPRPVVVGSRIIGTDRIGLGRHFWQGVCKLC